MIFPLQRTRRNPSAGWPQRHTEEDDFLLLIRLAIDGSDMKMQLVGQIDATSRPSLDLSTLLSAGQRVGTGQSETRPLAEQALAKTPPR